MHNYNLNTNIALVDEHDVIIGETDLISAHLGQGKRHRAVSVFLLNKHGDVLVQQRSPKKIVGALQWGNTCCGNVHVGETREQCAYRRLKEELGISEVSISPLYIFEYQTKCDEKFSEWEIDQVFVGKYDGEVLPNADEVINYNWVKPADLLMDLKRSPKKYVPWLEKILKEKKHELVW